MTSRERQAVIELDENSWVCKPWRWCQKIKPRYDNAGLILQPTPPKIVAKQNPAVESKMDYR